MALEHAKPRWKDMSYCTRMVISYLMQDSILEETGFGIYSITGSNFDLGETTVVIDLAKENIITFGSINQKGSTTIKPGTPYKLIFTPKTQLTNTSGLIFTYFAEAVDFKANKIILKIQ
jgi:hypothetical protein